MEIKADNLQGIGAVNAREFDGAARFKSVVQLGDLNAGGAIMEFGQRVVDVVITANSSTVTAAAIKDGEWILGVTVRNLTALTGTTIASYSVGDGTTAGLWGAGVVIASGTTTTSASFASAAPIFYTADTNVVLTPNAGDFDTGTVRVVATYFKMGAPAK
jgi:hypothetical protein